MDQDELTILTLMEWARSHLDQRLSLDVLAGRAFMSRRTFCRRFRQVAGVSPGEWVLREKVALAQELLEGPGLTVDRIAGRAGFGSDVIMRRHFRRIVGCSPTEYRDRLLSSPAVPV